MNETIDYSSMLQGHGVRPTAMRLLVCRELGKARRPLSLRELEERMVTAERSTIFRALTLLYEHHIVHAIEDGSGTTRYELCHATDAHKTDDDQHPHFHCEHCHRTFCLHDVPLPQVLLPQGYCPTTINLLIKGLCPECLAKNPNLEGVTNYNDRKR